MGSTYENGNLTRITRGGYIPGSTAKKTQEYNYTYDAFGRQTGVSIGGERIADYGYNDGNGTLKYVYYGFTAEPLASVTYGYDLLGRLDTVRHYDNNSRESTEYGYAYSSDGNLAGITKNGEPVYSYDYDTLGRLIYSSRIEDGKRVLYTAHQYDTRDRILSQSWQIGTYSAVLETYEFSYADDRDWKDQLTGVTYTDYNSDGKESGMLTYDAMGNPLTYFNGKKSWSFTWKYGRQLVSATDGIHTITNTYDVDGVRESKTVDGVEHKYVTLDGKIIRETYGSVTVDYFYDNEGRPYKLVVDEDNSTSGGSYTGYFVLNQQGDVIAILNANGVKVVSYEYNAWGQIKEETATSTNVGTLFLEHNALKYRGYYYDAETGFYYVSSRYYDPVIGRFINADTTDVLTVNPIALTDKNLYAYCDNNPVIRIDESGKFWNIATGAIIGGLISGASQALDNIATGKCITEGLAVAVAGGALTGALGATGVNKFVQAAVSGIVSGVSDYIAQVRTKGIENVNLKQVGVSVVIGIGSGLLGGDGIRHKKGNVAKTKNLYDGFIDCVKNGKWNSRNASGKITYLAQNYRKVLNREVGITTAKYTFGTAGANFAKKIWESIQRRKK